MTEAEENEIVQSVLEAIQTNSKTIDQLTAIEELKDGDYMEVNGGRRIAYKTLCNLVASMAREELVTFKQIAETRLSEIEAKDDTQDGSIETIKSKNAEQDGLISSLQKVNTTQTEQIQGLNTLVEQNSVNIENVTDTANTNKNNITALQGDVSDNASAIDSLQKNAVSKHQELTDKIDANNEFISQVESTCNSRQDEADVKNAEQDAKMKSLDNIDEQILIRLEEMQLSIDALSQRVKALEN